VPAREPRDRRDHARGCEHRPRAVMGPGPRASRALTAP
jgi:hypothetical protein